MPDASNAPPAYAGLVDCLFANLPSQPRAPVARPRSSAFAGTTSNPPPEFPQPPPSLDDPANVQAVYEWFKTEKTRLEEYTRSQFELLRGQSQTLMAKHFQGEEALAARAQELNREMKFLATQSESLQARARELAEREQLLASQMERLAQAQAELLSIQETSENVRRDTEAQQASLLGLRAETAALQEKEAAARTELAGFETALKVRQQALQRKQGELSARLGEMEQRYLVLEKTETTTQRRIAELDEWEERLRKEFEENERQLNKERQELRTLLAVVDRAGLRHRDNRAAD